MGDDSKSREVSAKKGIMNDGESFPCFFLSIFCFLGLFCYFFFSQHFFSLHKNESDGDDDDGGVSVCVVRRV